MARSAAAWFAKKDAQSARMAAKEPPVRKKNRDARLKRTYGISAADYDNMLAKQNGVCAICKLLPEYELYVDHDHITGAVRGLLCAPCNTALGQIRDDCDRISAALEYLFCA